PASLYPFALRDALPISSFQHAKGVRLQDWLASEGFELAGSWFYSDSHNDLPLLEIVDHPVAVDPDATLGRIAAERGWPIISLREDRKSTRLNSSHVKIS